MLSRILRFILLPYTRYRRQTAVYFALTATLQILLLHARVSAWQWVAACLILAVVADGITNPQGKP